MVFRRRRGECGRLNNVAFGRSLVVLRWKIFCVFFALVFLSLFCVLCARISGGKRGGGEIFARGANVEGFPKRDVDSRSIRWMRIAFLRSNARFDGRAGVNRARFFSALYARIRRRPSFFLSPGFLFFFSKRALSQESSHIIIMMLTTQPFFFFFSLNNRSTTSL